MLLWCRRQRGQRPSMTELSLGALEVLREGTEFVLFRGIDTGSAPILAVVPFAEQPSIESLRRLEHEYLLRTELDPAWSARPLALTRCGGRMALVLEDPGGEPLDLLLGRPLETSHFLRIAISLAATVGR